MVDMTEKQLKLVIFEAFENSIANGFEHDYQQNEYEMTGELIDYGVLDDDVDDQLAAEIVIEWRKNNPEKDS